MDSDKKEVYKIVLVGESSVGKTSILNRLLGIEFNTEEKFTFGAQYFSKNIKVNHSEIKTEIWDTSGQERVRKMNTLNYRGSDGFVVILDVSNHETLEKAKRRLEEIRETCPENAKIILVGNKAEEGIERQITNDELKKFAKKEKISYFEASGKENKGIIEAFEFLCDCMVNNKNPAAEEKEEEINENNQKDPEEDPKDIENRKSFISDVIFNLYNEVPTLKINQQEETQMANLLERMIKAYEEFKEEQWNNKQAGLSNSS